MIENRNINYLKEISSFISSFRKQDIDKNTLNHAAITLTDTYATAFSGIKTQAFITAFQNAEHLFGRGDYDVWGMNFKSSLLGSVFYNTLAISSTDFDDGHRKAIGHPASALAAVAILLGREKNAELIDILKSVIVGYEVATRFSLSRKPESINSYSSGRWAAFGTVATAAYLIEMKTDDIVQALSNAFVLSPHMLGGSSDVSTGSMSKEGVAWAAQSGLQSAMFAKSGFSGPYLFLEESNEFDMEKLVEGIGDSFLINSNYFKPYACCRWLHPAINASQNIIEKNKFSAKDISKVKVYTFSRLKDLMSEAYPTNVIMAQFHLPYALAIMIVYGDCGPGYFHESYLKNEHIKQIIDKIEIIEVDKYTNIFPGQLASRVEIEVAGNKLIEEKMSAPWDYGNHPSKEEIKHKFHKQTSNYEHINWDWFFNY